MYFVQDTKLCIYFLTISNVSFRAHLKWFVEYARIDVRCLPECNAFACQCQCPQQAQQHLRNNDRWNIANFLSSQTRAQVQKWFCSQRRALFSAIELEKREEQPLSRLRNFSRSVLCDSDSFLRSRAIKKEYANFVHISCGGEIVYQSFQEDKLHSHLNEDNHNAPLRH